VTDSSAAEYDVEAWALGCSAILAAVNGLDVHQFGMFEKNDILDVMPQTMLSNSWDINSREELIDAVTRMTDGGHNADYVEMSEEIEQIPGSLFPKILEEATPEEAAYIQLTKEIGKRWGDKQIKAWDWFRMMHIIGWGYNAGYLDLEEAHSYMEPVIERLHGTFSSWDEATQNYMDGYAWWSREDITDPNGEYQRRLELYESLKKNNPDLFDESMWE
jgi:hypothetical protein